MLILLLVAALAWCGMRAYTFVQGTLRSLPQTNHDWHWW